MEVNIFSKSLLMAILLADFFLNKTDTYKVSSHGETCDSTNRCNSRASLTCNNGICECIMPDIMLFDAGMCKVLAGEKCSFITVDLGSENKRLNEELPCVTNSLCKDGFCSCIFGYFETANRTCLPKRNIGEICESNRECNNTQNLICDSTEKVCKCDNIQTTFDVFHQTCVKLVGVPCNITNNNPDLCVQYAQCLEGVCTCYDNQYFANPERKCELKRGFNESCEDNSYCLSDWMNDDFSPSSVCNFDKRCGCNSSFATYAYGSRTEKCLKLVGVPCTNRFHNPRCVDNSYCRGEYSDGHCTCDSEYINTSAGLCERKRFFGEPCQSSNHCETESGLKCGSKGVCECQDPWRVFDPAQKDCVTLAEIRCKHEDDKCVHGARCTWYWGGNYECKCSNRLSLTANGSCLGTHRDQCGLEWTTQCNEKQGLICSEGECACKHTLQYFNTTLQKCVSYVDGVCDDFIPCAANSHCSEELDGVRKCECSQGFAPVDHACQLSVGQRCEYKPKDGILYDGNTCDQVAPLKCIQGVCQCNNWEHYDNGSMKCRGLVGTLCKLEKAIYCTPNASCSPTRSARETFEDGTCKCGAGYMTTKDTRCVAKLALAEVV